MVIWKFEMDNVLVENRFKRVMIPAILMGLVTNICLTCLFYFIDAIAVAISPAVSAVFFLIYVLLFKKEVVTSKQISLIVAYSTVIEVFIHSYFLGWGMGFYCYMFLLPVVFLLNTNWKKWMVIFFNSSMVVLSILLWGITYNNTPVYTIPNHVISFIGLFNIAVCAIIIYVVMVYFSRTVNRKDEDLMEANIRLENKNKKIVGQHKKLEVLLKEVHHRVKNNLQIITSLMSLEGGKVKSEEAVTVLNESRRRVEAIALIHQKLYQDSEFTKVDIKSYLEEIMLGQERMNPHVSCTVVSVNIELSLDTALPLGLIISELITNSMAHAFNGIENPALLAELRKTEEGFELLLKDNGIGLAEGFDLNQTESLGIEIITLLTEQIEGAINCFNNDSGGASFKLNFKDQ